VDDEVRVCACSPAGLLQGSAHHGQLEVPVLDMSALPTQAAMRLTKLVPRKEGAGLAWDAELAMEVADEDAAQVVEQYLPGAQAVFDAREASKGDVKTSGGFDLCRVEFQDAEGERLARGHCEVRSVACKAHAQQAVLVLRLRVHGLLLEAAMRVVSMLDELVQLRLEDHSQQLSLLPKPGPPALEGRLVVHATGDRVVAGIVAAQDGRTLQLATMEAEALVELTLQGAHPDTALHVVAPDGSSMRDDLVAYVTRCDEARVPASWNDVVTALGQLHAEHAAAARPDFSWELTPAVWDAAFALATQQGVVRG